MAGATERGRLKVFLGMAPGVGKTYRMLQEGRSALSSGRDVAVGLVETHGRAETTALSWDMEIVPRRTVVHRGTTLQEMDLPALLRRAPELCLVDELAHTNAPGLEHAKRHEDVQALLQAGIDVDTTLNIQHLESLNDQVTELTGVRVRETVPDTVLTAADEVVVVDVTPEALIARMRDGRIYPAERIEASLNGFFRIENLAALREVVLREVAEGVDAKRESVERLGTREDADGAEIAVAVGERLLALVRPQPSAQRLVRRAWRSAQRLGASLDVLWVRGPGEGSDADAERGLAALRQLCSVLGATLLVEDGDDVVAVLARVARERGTTYVLVGESAPRRGLARLRTPLPQAIMRATPPGVDVRIVADRARREGAS